MTPYSSVYVIAVVATFASNSMDADFFDQTLTAKLPARTHHTPICWPYHRRREDNPTPLKR